MAQAQVLRPNQSVNRTVNKLVVAIYDNELEKVKSITERDPRIAGIMSKSGYAPIHASVHFFRNMALRSIASELSRLDPSEQRKAFESRDIDQNASLHHAAVRNNFAAATLILFQLKRVDGDTSPINSAKMSPSDLAERAGYYEMCAFLRENGVRSNIEQIEENVKRQLSLDYVSKSKIRKFEEAKRVEIQNDFVPEYTLARETELKPSFSPSKLLRMPNPNYD